MKNPAHDSVRNIINSQRNMQANALLAPQCQPFSYGRLVEQIDYVGHTLRKLQISRSDCVAVVLPNGPEMASAFLGIAAYATCAPLNPLYRHEDVEYYLKDLGARAIVVPADTDLAAREVAEQLGLVLLDLDSSSDTSAGGFSLRGFPVRTPRPSTGGRMKTLPWCCTLQERHPGLNKSLFHTGISVPQPAISPAP